MTPKLAIHGGKPTRTRKFEILPLIGREEKRAVEKVLDSRLLSNRGGGPYTRKFEEAFAKFHGVKFGVAVTSGTTALHLALSTIDVGPGDEVIVPAFTFISTASVVLQQNAIPVFADIDPITYCIDPANVEDKITEKTKAIIPVHLAGHPAEIKQIMEIARDHNLVVVEDCAQAHSARYKGKLVGTWGDIGCFSFYQTKNITAGEGGIVITDNEELANSLRLKKEHGSPSWYKYETLGYNYQMTELQAVILLVQLKKLEYFNKKRKINAKLYKENLEELDVILPQVKPNCDHVFHIFEVLLPKQFPKGRERFVKAVKAENVPITVCYPTVLYKSDLFVRKKVYKFGCPFNCPYYSRNIDYSLSAPVAEDISSRVFTLMTDPSLDAEIIKDTSDAIAKVYFEVTNKKF